MSRLRFLLPVALLLLPGCRGSSDPSSPSPRDAPSAATAPAATPAEERDEEEAEDGPSTVQVEKPMWTDKDGNPVTTPTPSKTKRWNGLVVGNWKEPLPGVPADRRCVVLSALVGSPAATAGLRLDDVILKAGAQEVRQYQDYIAAARTVEVGQTLTLTVQRGAQTLTVDVGMLEKPGDLNQWRREHFPGTAQADYDLPLLRPATGGTVASGAARGKPQVLYFWATWCGPCRATSPAVSKLHDELGDKVAVVGITNEERPVIDTFIKDHPEYTYPVGWDVDGEVKRHYEIKKLPTIVLVGPDGRVLEWDISVGGVNRVLARARELVATPG